MKLSNVAIETELDYTDMSVISKTRNTMNRMDNTITGIEAVAAGSLAVAVMLGLTVVYEAITNSRTEYELLAEAGVLAGIGASAIILALKTGKKKNAELDRLHKFLMETGITGGSLFIDKLLAIKTNSKEKDKDVFIAIDGEKQYLVYRRPGQDIRGLLSRIDLNLFEHVEVKVVINNEMDNGYTVNLVGNEIELSCSLFDYNKAIMLEQ